MKLRSFLSLSVAALGVVANATIDMNHIAPVAGLTSTANFGVMQVFGDFPSFSGTVVDDFKASGSTIDLVGVAFEITNPALDFNQIKGWRVSIWNNPTDASNSGNDLSGNTVATTVGSANYTELFAAGVVNRTFEADVAVNLGVKAGGVYWIGMAPLLDFTNNGQTFILSNTTPAVLGNNTANNSVGVNPGNGFGLGTQVAVGTNAAYGVDTVPEPASMVAIGAGLLALARKRRK